MKDKSLTGTSLSLVFCMSGYIAYVYAVMKQNTALILVASLIYFLPLFIDFSEDLQTTRVGNPYMFRVLVVCFCIGLVYATVLFSYLAIFEGSFTDPLPRFMRFLVILLPVACLPIKAYPLGVKIMQLANRNRGRRSSCKTP
ncbi:MAG: hypothetical protein IJN67_00795 [Oscillospiraceae bacterium]|nr:hypothetical protein [Oscillospiraceae bacterium]